MGENEIDMALRNKLRRKTRGLEVHNLKDSQLVQLVIRGRGDAFFELFKRYEAKVKQLAFRITHSTEDAEDICQEVFTTVYLKLRDFEGKSAFSSWLYRIAFNASLMKLRKEKSRSLNTNIDDIEELKIQVEQSKVFKTEDCQDLTELREMILSSIDKLPAQYKYIVTLGDLQNLTHEEISEITGLSVSAIKSRLHRARVMLKKRLRTALMETPKLALYEHVSC
ncbi:MAG: sigma-70 family RNA polymerase sigma factor [Deltaproteobacteria bacterium]|nr:sigma-70 family RNA polymerase sigma factor [Deltaproteobacteria bacterium]